MICNADEGDPGAFMDRAVLESDPHAVLEGLAIGAYAIGAEKAIVYARAEYPLAIERLLSAINQMKNLGFLGKNIMESAFNLEIKIKMGAGAFVCGEETALVASIEGKRGMPRPRPPFPAQSGLDRKPTNINHVETLANVSEIMRLGPNWFAGYGTEKSKGTKTFALAGKIERTGLVEVPMGSTINEIIFDIGGGVLDQKKFKAIQTGGPSGGSIPAEMLDLKVDYEELAKAGSIMGSGGMIVMDEDSCMVDVARYFLEFIHSESCGKCVPCRIGSQHLLQLLTNITKSKGDTSYIGRLERLAKTVQSGSLCGLGQTASNPTISTLRYFRSEYEAHIHEKRCAAGVCGALVATHALEDKCLPCLESVAGYDAGGYEALKSVLPELVPERLLEKLRTSGCAVDFARFSMTVPVQNKSCTKCSSCRLGAAQMENILHDIATGKGKPEMLDLLYELMDTMSLASECPVGKTGSDIVLFLLDRFRDQFDAHILETACPSGVCSDLLAYETICPLRAGEWN
jgi:NADH:ubiquinone oxidoreductase subunit F (NADH-binding)